MLKLLSGRVHEVFTSYRILEVKKGKVTRSYQKTCATRVRFSRLDQHALKAYLQTGEGLDKAGAYAAQGIGMGLIRSIHGSYTNVMGLPLAEVLASLREKFAFKQSSLI